MNTCHVAKGPLPVKFYPMESDFLREAHRITGVPMVELVRRGVRFLKRQQELSRSYGFITELAASEEKG